MAPTVRTRMMRRRKRFKPLMDWNLKYRSGKVWLHFGFQIQI
jgi:hypothetical protein